MSEDDRNKLRDLLGTMRAERLAAEAASTTVEGPMDEAYFNGLPREEGVPEGEFELEDPKGELYRALVAGVKGAVLLRQEGAVCDVLAPHLDGSCASMVMLENYIADTMLIASAVSAIRDDDPSPEVKRELIAERLARALVGMIRPDLVPQRTELYPAGGVSCPP